MGPPSGQLASSTHVTFWTRAPGFLPGVGVFATPPWARVRRGSDSARGPLCRAVAHVGLGSRRPAGQVCVATSPSQTRAARCFHPRSVSSGGLFKRKSEWKSRRCSAPGAAGSGLTAPATRPVSPSLSGAVYSVSFHFSSTRVFVYVQNKDHFQSRL